MTYNLALKVNKSGGLLSHFSIGKPDKFESLEGHKDKKNRERWELSGKNRNFTPEIENF
jgi:hypothetical protein